VKQASDNSKATFAARAAEAERLGHLQANSDGTNEAELAEVARLQARLSLQAPIARAQAAEREAGQRLQEVCATARRELLAVARTEKVGWVSHYQETLAQIYSDSRVVDRLVSQADLVLFLGSIESELTRFEPPPTPQRLLAIASMFAAGEFPVHLPGYVEAPPPPQVIRITRPDDVFAEEPGSTMQTAGAKLPDRVRAALPTL
jgi:hypothetical protein